MLNDVQHGLGTRVLQERHHLGLRCGRCVHAVDTHNAHAFLEPLAGGVCVCNAHHKHASGTGILPPGNGQPELAVDPPDFDFLRLDNNGSVLLPHAALLLPAQAQNAAKL